MPEQAPQRRLAAILVADVVGYSRMMQADEAGTLAALKSRRTAILQPLVSKHHGRIIKVMGDGVLVEFASAVSAGNARSIFSRQWPPPIADFRTIIRSCCASESTLAT